MSTIRRAARRDKRPIGRSIASSTSCCRAARLEATRFPKVCSIPSARTEGPRYPRRDTTFHQPLWNASAKDHDAPARYRDAIRVRGATKPVASTRYGAMPRGMWHRVATFGGSPPPRSPAWWTMLQSCGGAAGGHALVEFQILLRRLEVPK